MGQIISARTVKSFLAAMILALGIVAIPLAAAAPSAPVEVNFDAMIADAMSAMLVDPHQTIAKARAAQAVAEDLPPTLRSAAVAKTQWLQGEAYLRLDDASHAGPLIQQALMAVSRSRVPTKLHGDILISLGGYHTAIADVAAALADYQQAHNIFRDAGETRSRAIALLSIAGLYQESKDYENALKYYGQALDVYHGDPQLQLSIYNNRGDVLKELHRFKQANAAFGDALKLARTMKSPVLEVPILRNMARSQLLAGDLQAADQTIAEGFRVARLIQGGPLAAQMWDIAAKAALLHHRLPEARAMIERSFAGVDPLHTTISYREAHETAFQIYRGLGDETKALVNLEALKRLDDKATTLATSANTALMAARFDYANQELRIAKLKADELQRNIDFERARAQAQRFIFIGIAVVTLIIVTMLGFGLVTIRRSRNEVRAANIDLGLTNSALAKALAAKTEFLATTSHEIRTPLNGILGMTQVMLADRTLGETIRDRIGVVHGAGITMRALVDDILDVAKMETGNLTIERAPFDVRATLTDLARMWQEQAQGKGIGFTLDLADCPHWIEGDAARLRQVAFNLLSNALKFTEAGSVTLHAAESAGPNGPLLVIDVTDTGIGIPADKHELIFESFRQADGGTTRKFGGTGLGLSICRNLARAMEGDVTVASSAGQGATFSLSLPLLRASAPEAAVAVAQQQSDALLIVDRNPITRAMLRTMLEPRAGAVVFAASVEEAVELIAAGGIAVAVADEGTVRTSDDIDAALTALARAAAQAGTTTALLWAGLDDAQRESLARTGIDRLIAKPIAGPALAALLYPTGARDDSAPNHLATHAA